MVDTVQDKHRPVFLQRLLMWGVVRSLINMDVYVSDFIESRFRGKAIRNIIKVLSDILVYLFPFALLIFGDISINEWGLYIAVLLGCLFVSERILKPIFRRERPYYLDGIVTGGRVRNFSFPSSHSLTAGFILGLWLRLGAPWQGLAWAVGVFIPFSRVALNVHFVSDVVVGWVLGVLVALIV